MTKYRVIAILLLMSTLTGCSSNSNASSNGTNILYKNKPIQLTELSSMEAKYENEVEGVKIKYRICEGYMDCTSNTHNIRDEDMDSYKKAKYYSMFLDTVSVVHLQSGSDLYEAVITTDTDSSNIAKDYVPSVYEVLKTIKLGKELKSASLNGVTIKSANIIVRDKEIIIPNVLRVTSEITEGNYQEIINDVTFAIKESNKYKYYTYKDSVTIQAAKDVNIFDYVTIK